MAKYLRDKTFSHEGCGLRRQNFLQRGEKFLLHVRCMWYGTCMCICTHTTCTFTCTSVHVQRKQADVFALDTDEQDLTHRGRSIRDMERFDDINITDEEVEEEGTALS